MHLHNSYYLQRSSELEDELRWTPLQLYSVNERLKTPCPPLNTEDKRYDFTNVVDVCCNFQKLKVTGSTDKIGTSQLVPNSLKIDFLAFKSLTKLHLENLDISSDHITSLGILRNTLQILQATHCNLTSASQLLLCDVAHDNSEEDLTRLIATATYTWSHLLHLDLR